VDNDFALWRALHNHYWPALYFADTRGHIRQHRFGEGDYERSERVLRQLLAEGGQDDIGDGLAVVEPRPIERSADWDNVGSPESYVGFGSVQQCASPGPVVSDTPRIFEMPARLKLNQWALSGEWTLSERAAQANVSGCRFAYRFHARDLFLVFAPPRTGASVRFRVTLDGRSPGESHGLDIDGGGNGIGADPRLYHLIRQPSPISDRDFEIEFFDTDVSVYVLTFG
jgi:hypothetical protein